MCQGSWQESCGAREEMAGFLGRYGQAYYYENGQKAYLLEEAIVRRKYEPRYYSPVERQSQASLDSSAIAGMKELGIRQIIERLRGLQVEGRSVTLMGKERPTAFYSPKYGRSPGLGSESKLDERSTIYWNPDVRFSRDNTARLSFYTADRYDIYTITVEGVTSGGEILRKQIKMEVEGDSSR